ncbi:hypothetical protein H7F33_13630 [Pedobacter sp. PAMC26386]|nr:hypothetical protein H7F33_13630 [Pedobacter sp. PAMC26386]
MRKPDAERTQYLYEIKFATAISVISLTHEAVADFLEKGRYKSHLKKLRNTLNSNYLNYIEAIRNDFPEGTKISRPQGGCILWVDLDRSQINNAIKTIGHFLI